MRTPRVEFVPRTGATVLLLDGRTGTVGNVLAWWAALRCWDAVIIEPYNPATREPEEDRARTAQIRETPRRKKGEPEWREVAP